LIQLQHISKVYEGATRVEALKDISLDVKEGEIFGIIGQSGAGKSTLIRCINMLEAPTSGSVIVNGTDLTTLSKSDLRKARKDIGMIFQHFNLLSSRTVYDNVAFPLELQGLSKVEIKERITPILDIVGLSDRVNNYPSQLSGGQMQRVAIAGVVALRPDILILDEATSMLDPEGRLELIKIVQKIRKDHQMTVISITHDLDEVAMSDRILVMKKGEIESTSTPRELFSRSDLDQIGLDQPFVNQLKESLRTSGLKLPEHYLTEEELEEALWELF